MTALEITPPLCNDEPQLKRARSSTRQDPKAVSYPMPKLVHLTGSSRLAPPGYVIGTLLFLAASLLGAGCLPGDRGSSLLISNECEHEIWVRARNGSALPADMLTSAGERIVPGTAVDFPGPDSGIGGITVSVSAVQNEAGKLLTVPHSDEKSPTFHVRGEMCPGSR